MRLLLIVLACVSCAPIAWARADLDLRAENPTSLEDCERLADEFPDDLHAYRCYWVIARQTNARDEGAALLERKLAAAPDDPYPKLYLARIMLELNRQGSVSLLERGIDEFEVLGEYRGAVWGALLLSYALPGKGRAEAVGPLLDRASAWAQLDGSADLVAQARTARGWSSFRRGAYEAARRDFESAKSLEGEVPDYVRRDLLDGLAAVAWSEGKRREAYDTYAEMLERWEGADAYYDAGVLRNMLFVGMPLVIDGELGEEDVVARAERLREVAESAKRWDALSTALLALSNEADDAATALDYAREAMAAAERSGVSSEIRLATQVLISKLGRFGDDEGLREALSLAEREIELAASRDDPRTLGTVQLLHWGIRRALGEANPRGALEALATWDEIRARQSKGETRTRVFSVLANDYRDVAGKLLTSHMKTGGRDELDAAFEVWERLRARTLLDTLTMAGLEEIPLSERFTTVDETRAHLQSNEAMLVFQAGNSRIPFRQRGTGGSWVLVLTREEARVLPLPDERELRRWTETFRELIERRDGSEAEAGATIYRALVEPVLEVLPTGVSSLVIVPDGALHHLPFAALAPEPGATPFGVSYALSLIPSATVWKQWREGHATLISGGVISFSDPSAMPGPEASEERAEDLGPLPFARSEAVEVRRALGGGEVLVGERASKAELTQRAAEPAALLHVAAHALVDETRPERSMLRLADGALTFAEIGELRLGMPLVMLTACRSAEGLVLGGEGALGLAQAFFRSGARSVVAGLWPLRDRETADLVAELSGRLGQGIPLAEALREARAALIERGAPTADWAGLVLLGEGSLRLKPREPLPSLPWRPLLALPLGLVALLALWRVFRP